MFGNIWFYFFLMFIVILYLFNFLDCFFVYFGKFFCVVENIIRCKLYFINIGELDFYEV